MTRLQVTTVAAFGLSVVFIVWGKNTQADNFFISRVQPTVRTTLAPNYLDEMTRKLVKAEAKRPLGCVQTFEPVRTRKCDKPAISDADRSSLSSIIIKEVLR